MRPTARAVETPRSPLPLQEQETDEFVLEEKPFDASLLEPSENKDALGRLGKYELLAVVGRGGMGVVLRGTDTQLCRPVAIKLLNRALSSSDTARRRFLRQARAAAAINHPHVVTIYAVEEFRGTPLIVMEFVPGCTLRERIQRAGRLPPLEVLRISTQVAAGLAAAHAQGVIHRDVKPGNIMIEEPLDRAKLTDFGVARAAADQVELTARGAAVGTPAYMAPEQVRGEKIDARADLFGLGCVIYAMCVGHSPFHGRNTWEIARRVNELEPRPLHEQDPTVPEFLSDIVARLLQKNPDERFQSAAEVADLLSRHLAQLNQTPSDEINGVLYRPSKPVATPPPPRRRIGWLTAAAAFVILGIAMTGYWQLRERYSSKATPTPVPAVSPDPLPLAGMAADTTVQTISVSKQGEANARTIAEALARAQSRHLDSRAGRRRLRRVDRPGPRRPTGGDPTGQRSRRDPGPTARRRFCLARDQEHAAGHGAGLQDSAGSRRPRRRHPWHLPRRTTGGL